MDVLLWIGKSDRKLKPSIPPTLSDSDKHALHFSDSTKSCIRITEKMLCRDCGKKQWMNLGLLTFRPY